MTSVEQPPNWVSGFTPLMWLGSLLCLGSTGYSAAQLIVAAREREFWPALTAGGLTVCFFGFLATVVTTVALAARDRTDATISGTTFRVNPVIAWCYGVGLAGGVVGAAAYLWTAWNRLGNLPFAAQGGGYTSRVLMIALLVLCLSGLIALLRTREPGYLRLGVDGIEHADMLRTRSARWVEVRDVLDKADKPTRNPVVFVVVGTKPIVVPNADRYGSAGAPIYWMVRHYLQHPENRDELGDGRGLERLSKGEFDSA